MKKNERKLCMFGILLLAAFALWTFLVQTVDVQPVGQNGTDIGFAALNCRFFALTGVHMALYTMTDWLGLVPICVCMLFFGVGVMQCIKRKSLFKADFDIVLLGVYYGIVLLCYLAFEAIPINYRPVPIDGFMEASYPSSTTLLVLGVMPTLVFQAERRLKSHTLKTVIRALTVVFSVCMVIGRLISGVHWFTDIMGSVLLSTGLFVLYKAIVLHYKE